MGIEIERKFLLRDARWRESVTHRVRMIQGYLVDARTVNAGGAKSSVRVRIEGDEARLNVKSATLGIEREEFEYLIPRGDAERMLASLCDGVLEKTRHYVPHAGRTYEIDEFSGENTGLVVAELELEVADVPFARPDWLGTEVSTLRRYYNLNLIAYPYSRWSEAERAGQAC